MKRKILDYIDEKLKYLDELHEKCTDKIKAKSDRAIEALKSADYDCIIAEKMKSSYIELHGLLEERDYIDARIRSFEDIKSFVEAIKDE